jgi:hypothetical protein
MTICARRRSATVAAKKQEKLIAKLASEWA